MYGESQLYGEMTPENYGKFWRLNLCLTIASFNLLDENEMKTVSIGLI